MFNIHFPIKWQTYCKITGQKMDKSIRLNVFSMFYGVNIRYTEIIYTLCDTTVFINILYTMKCFLLTLQGNGIIIVSLRTLYIT